jgi:hypothetical protein
MLFIGPKNALASQMHLLHRSNNDESSFLVLTISQFEGFPMADYFKVLQYWAFQPVTTKSSTTVTVGLHIHYIRTTMLKSQISAGVKAELELQSKRWLTYATKRISGKFSLSPAPTAIESLRPVDTVHIAATATVSGGEDHKRGMDRLVLIVAAVLLAVVLTQLYHQHKLLRLVADLVSKVERLEQLAKARM